MKLTVKASLGPMLTHLDPKNSHVAYDGKLFRYFGADRNDDGSFTVTLRAVNPRDYDWEPEPLQIQNEDTYGKGKWE